MKEFKITGKVLALDTQQGVPNLVVGAFDKDSRRQQPNDPLANIGDALGSTLTNSAGEFEISFATEDFIQQDPEGRPDLILAVFAPSDSTYSNETGEVTVKAQPRYKRLLHFIDIPRKNAASIEAYVIRLLPSQLDELVLRPTPERSKTKLEQHYVHSDLFANTEIVRRKEEIRRKGNLKRRVSKLVPESVFKQISPKGDPRLNASTPEAVNQAMITASAIGLRNLFEQQYMKPPALKLRESQLEKLDFNEDQNGEKTISAVGLVNVLNEIHPGVISESSISATVLRKLKNLKEQMEGEEEPNG